MKPQTLLFGIFSLLCVLGGSWFLTGQFCPALNSTAPASTTFSIEDGAFKANSTGSFNFGFSSATLRATKDVSNNIFQKVGKHLGDNPNKALLLTGLYAAKETNRTEFSNLGMARAEALKEQLVRYGAAAEQITVEGVEKEKLDFLDKRVHNPVKFTFSEITTAESTETSTDEVSEGNGMTLFFKDDVTRISSNDPEIQRIIEYLESYIATHPKAVITVTGYTDSKGGLKKKMTIAKERAKRVRRIIRDYGGGGIFKSRQVVRKVEGPKNPIGDNSTEEGRARNNRVTITVE